MSIEALLASPHWRWMPGMKVKLPDEFGGPYRVLHAVHTPEETRVYFVFCNAREIDSGAIGKEEEPDLTDPATLGCLLALVREAWGDPTKIGTLLVQCNPSYAAIHECSISIEIGDTRRRFLGLSEDFCSAHAEALVAALLAAPLPTEGR